MSRQAERRNRFQTALAKMPLWETWTTSDPDVPPRVVATNTYEKRTMRGIIGINTVTKTVEVEPPRIRRHCRIVPRRVRRVMARVLSKREYRAAHGLV